MTHAAFLRDVDAWRDELRSMSSCPACGSLEPVRLGDGGCSDCRDYPGCCVCGRWVDTADAPPFTLLSLPDGAIRPLCDRCRERDALAAEDPAEAAL